MAKTVPAVVLPIALLPQEEIQNILVCKLHMLKVALDMRLVISIMLFIITGR